MTRFIVLLLTMAALSGCAHKELKAPCKNIASLANGDVPCNQREPINSAHIPSLFGED